MHIASKILRKKLVSALAGMIVGSVGLARAAVRLPSFFADHMVVQRNLPVHVWGMAAPGEAVSVRFRGQTESTAADPWGRWSVYLRPGAAGGPYELTIQGGKSQATNRIAIEDVLVGDVWVASGQSNMEFPMAPGMNRGVENEKAEIAAANFPRIRLLDIDPRSSEYPLSDVAIRHPWSPCTPGTVANFSAVAYYFARDVQRHEHVPIGIIDDTWGGTIAEAWVSMDALTADASLMPVFAWRAQRMAALPGVLLQEKQEAKEAAEAKAAGRPAPEVPWRQDPVSWRPAGVYNAMIAPLTPFAIKGVLWYQGASNAYPISVPVYGRIFRALIRDWRAQWTQGDFPFLFVQLPNFSPGELWPELRQQQRDALALRDTAMAVTIDVGDPDNIHPKDKKDVGARLARAARAIAYGEPIEYSGPMSRQVTTENHALRVWFNHVQGGLVSRNGGLQGFAIAGRNGKYVPADARIDGDTVVVSSSSVNDPVGVRYGWQPNPKCNLYNGAGLPASPFEMQAFDHPVVAQEF